MHDGSLNLLKMSVVIANDGFVRRSSLSPGAEPYSLTDDDRLELVAFLSTLTSKHRIMIPVLSQVIK